MELVSSNPLAEIETTRTKKYSPGIVSDLISGGQLSG